MCCLLDKVQANPSNLVAVMTVTNSFSLFSCNAVTLSALLGKVGLISLVELMRYGVA